MEFERWMAEMLEGDYKVIWAEDDDLLRDLGITLLEKYGEMKVESFPNGQEAFEFFENNRGEIDAVLSDYEMPMMNGLEFLKNVRSLDEQIPFVLYTGKGSEEIASNAISAGVTEYHRKGSGNEDYRFIVNSLERGIKNMKAREIGREQYEDNENLPFPMAKTNSNGDLRYANPHFRDLIDSEESIYGLNLEELKWFEFPDLDHPIETFNVNYGGRDLVQSVVSVEDGERYIITLIGENEIGGSIV